MYLSEVLVF